MKKALSADRVLIEATADAPKEATCPHCHSPVELRHRRRMASGGIAYFWRHRDQEPTKCPMRHNQ